MGFRIPLGGRKDPVENDEYKKGYDDGYKASFEDTAWLVDRARKAEARGRSGDDYQAHWSPQKPESRRMGFGGEDTEDRRRRAYAPEDSFPVAMLMDKLGKLEEGQEHIRHKISEATEDKLDPRLAAVLEAAAEVMDNPPSTWSPYLHRMDYAGIAKMEGKELLTALEARKPLKDIRKELTHTIAALFQMMAAHK